jgi:hypothetical protein
VTRVRRRSAGIVGPAGSTAHKDTVLCVLEATPDIAIEELRQTLADKGLVVGYGTIRRFFFARHAITRKKRLRTPASRIAPTS